MMPRLHRNNAAEWIMVIALTPVAWIVRGWNKMRGAKSAAKSKKPVVKPSTKAPRRPVQIEGLPPRTMN